MKISFFIFLSIIIILSLSNNIDTISFIYADKLKHILAFLTLSFFFYKSFENIKNIYKFTLLIIFACAIEIAQSFVGREASITDIAASIFGILLFLLVLKVIEENKNTKINGS